MTAEVTHLFGGVHDLIYSDDDGLAFVFNVSNGGGLQLSHGAFEDESCLSSKVTCSGAFWHCVLPFNYSTCA